MFLAVAGVVLFAPRLLTGGARARLAHMPRDLGVVGVLLLAVYSAGLAVPFLLTALGLGQFMRFYKNFRKYLHAVELVSGVLLLFVGGLVFFNRLTWLTGKLTFLNRFNL